VYNGKIAHGLASTEGGHIMYYLEDIEFKDRLYNMKVLEGFAPNTETIHVSKEWCVIKL
jgi:hypothetical protein